MVAKVDQNKIANYQTMQSLATCSQQKLKRKKVSWLYSSFIFSLAEKK